MKDSLVRVEVPVVWEPGAPETFPGRALSAWLYGEVAKRSEAVAAALHDAQGAKPFSLAVIPGPAGSGAQALRLCGGADAAGLLEDIGSGFSRALLDGRFLVKCGEPVVARSGGAQLVQAHLPGEAVEAVRLEFLTPAAFHSRGRTVPLPVPELVFGGLLDRWRAWSGAGIEPSARAAISECAAVRRHRVQSVSVTMQGRFTAFVGMAEFTLVRPHPAWAGLLGLLGEFAVFAGVGQKTGMGMGAVACTVEAVRRPREALPVATGPERGRRPAPARRS